MVRCSCFVVALLVLCVCLFFVCVCVTFCVSVFVCCVIFSPFRCGCFVLFVYLFVFCLFFVCCLFVCLLLILLFSNFSSTGRIKTGSLFTNEEPSSIRRTLEPFQRQSWETSERRCGAHMGFSERIDNILH